MPIMTVGTGRALIYSGIVAWDPSQPTTDGGVLPDHWYRSDSGLWQDAGVTPAVLDGAVIGRWEDLTANADHVNQAVAGRKPTLQNAAGDLLGGHPVIRFDGTDDYVTGLYTTGGNMNQPNTIFSVAALTGWVPNDASSRALYDGFVATNQLLYARNNDDPDKWAIFAVGGPLQGGATDASWHTWTALYNGAAGQFWKDGVSEAGPGNAWTNAMTGMTIGSRGGSGFAWFGDITEVIAYDADLSNADKNQVGNYLETRYALAYTAI